jgi:hypothetical protein
MRENLEISEAFIFALHGDQCRNIAQMKIDLGMATVCN